jgi:23S rRNA (cytidine2498-2'-O)-methyltransferase
VPGARPSTPEGAHTSPRVPIPRGKPREGTWLWTCREDATDDLLDELRHALPADAARVRRLEPGLVESRGAPTFDDGTIDVTFARQGVPVRSSHGAAPRSGGPDDDTDALFAALLEHVRASSSFVLHVWAPDTDVGNRRMPACAALEERLLARLAEEEPALAARRVSGEARVIGDATLVTIVSLASGGHVIGAQPLRDAVSTFPGGRARMRVDADRPSRAARKVEEALAWLGVAPGSGEVCVDLGAAPGGWSWALLERRARVIAVDPAELRPDVARHRGLTHEKKSAFGYEPDEPVDWLFCDMAWRPLEAAQLLAKWGRRRWTRIVVANLKLPMKQKAKIVDELRAIVHGGGFSRVRTRQLYHDRDEITLTAIR